MRLAIADDLAALVALETICFEPYRRDSVRLIAATLRDPAREVWVLESAERQIIASLTLRFPRRHARIYSIAVSPCARGSGVGGILLERAYASAREREITVVRLEVESARADLLGWYERQGFKPQETLKDFYGLNCPALQMEKKL